MKAILLNVTCICCFSIFLFNCKKDKAEPTNPSPTPPNLSTDSINGELSVIKYYDLNNDSLIFSHSKTIATFFQDKSFKYYTSLPLCINVGNISLNGVQFYMTQGTTSIYYDTTGTPFSMPYNWQISGNGSFQGFNHSESLSLPVYTSANSLPDTLSMAQQDTIDIGNYSGTLAKIIVQTPNVMMIKSIEYPSHTIILSPNDYLDAGIGGGTEATIYVDINKSTYKVINGKMYRFTTTTSFSRPLFLKTL